ncbi:MAG: sulfatase-like hydrolase/transferase [bacterium]|nr:sulfatase-like hydrolase/transferase [bacterium]
MNTLKTELQPKSENYFKLLSILFFKLLLLGWIAIWITRIAFYLRYPDFQKFVPLREVLSTLDLMLRFDLSTTTMMLIPAFLGFSISAIPSLRKLMVYFSVLVLVLSYWFSIGILWADTLYYGEAGKHLTFEVSAIQHDLWTMFKLLVANYPKALLLILFLYWFIPYLFERFLQPLINNLTTAKINWFQYSIGLLIYICIIILFLRGGFQYKPLRIGHAFRSDNVLAAHLTLNGYYTYITSKFARKGVQRHWMPMEQAISMTKQLVQSKNESFLHPKYPLLRKKEYPRHPITPRPNIVLLIIESLSAEYLYSFHGKIQTMPFFDSLSQHSVIFTNCYAVGTRSMEGISAIIGGIPNLMGGTFIGGEYEQSTLRGLGSILSENGYHCKFIHGAAKGSMGIQELANSCGYPIFYSKEQFSKQEDDGHWGIWDRYVLRRITKELDTMPTPSHIAAFTLSTHSPYLLPSDFYPPFAKHLPKAELYNSFANLDRELKQFFVEESKRPRFSETIYILIGDHTSETSSDIQCRFRVGCLIFAPTRLSAKEYTYFTSQVSIIPTILDLLQLSVPHSSFGKSFFDEDTLHQFAYFTHANYVGFAYQNAILLNNLDFDLKLIRPYVDPSEQINALHHEPMLANSLRSYLHAYYQTTLHVLKNNQIYPPHQSIIQEKVENSDRSQ